MRSGQRKRAVDALRSLKRRPEIVAFARAAARRGVDAWIVGGALRDRLLGRPAAEVDVAIARAVEDVAADLERDGVGRAVFLSRGRPGPRVFRIAARRPFDAAEIEGGTIEADLRRRDFTVNALALPLPSGDLIDPFGGLSDAAARRLRCVRAENLSEDPLRILRAARLFATHGLRPDRGVLAASRAAARLFSRAAPERVGAELAKLLAAPRAAPALAWTARAGILPATLGLPLSRSRALAVARSAAAFDDAVIRRLPPERRRLLRLAGLALRLRLPADRTRAWLSARRWSRDETRDAARLVELADRSRRGGSREKAWGWILDAGSLLPEALALLERLGPEARRRSRGLRAMAGSRPRPVAVTGRDVVEWLGIAEGPRVGELLRAVRVAAAMGTVSGRREARNWLVGQVRKSL
jgi:tRNA nucleotidyltransferase/poly(A) polymerase